MIIARNRGQFYFCRLSNNYHAVNFIFVKIFKKKKGSYVKSTDPNIQNLEKSIAEKIGLNVLINHRGKKGGYIKIEYKSLDQLELVTQKLKN